MVNNPFASKTYENTWLKHFNNDAKRVHEFDFIKNVRFIKHKWFPYYENIGKNLTNGMLYELDGNKDDFKGKSLIVYDVPNYILIDYDIKNSIKLKKIKQYEGCYGDISALITSEDIINNYFKSSKSKYNFKRSLRQLNEKLDASYKVYFGEISKDLYLQEMRAFKKLLSKRFDGKNTFNTVLPMWDFYEELIYPLIIKKKVALNVIYNEVQPIAMSINFIYDSSLAVAIRTFDIDYNKFNIGNIEIYKLIEWSVSNNLKTLDFSKGKGGYKERWTDTDYFYDFHILYDSRSISAVIIANYLAFYFKLKQYLRDKNVNGGYLKLKHLIKKGFNIN